MSIILIIIIAFVALVIAGHIKGPPKPKKMTIQNLIWRINSEEKWINKYLGLPYENQQSLGLKKQYREKVLYKMELMLELWRRGIMSEEQKQDITLIPVLQRSMELIRKGMSEKEAHKQAVDEFIKSRNDPIESD